LLFSTITRLTVVAVEQVPFKTRLPAEVVQVTSEVIADGLANTHSATTESAVISELEIVAKSPVVAEHAIFVKYKALPPPLGGSIHSVS
jgi:hypothetical protein